MNDQQVSTPSSARDLTALERAPITLAETLWRNRWHLAPVAAGAGVLTCGTTSTSLALEATAGLGVAAWRFYAWARAGKRPDRPVRMSVRERWIAGHWCTAAGSWCLAAQAAPALHDHPVLTLAAATSWPTVRWVRARAAKMPGRVSKRAAKVRGQWAEVARRPGPLHRSTIVRSTMTEPAPGAVTFEVHLVDAHTRDAATVTQQRLIEDALDLPADTVDITPIRERARRVRVTISLDRHLEAAPAAHPGLDLARDGTFPLAVDTAGKMHRVALANKDGVEHGVISGTTGSGKSFTVTVVMLPGLLAGVETTWYVDGKRGTSAPYLRPACDWYATDPADWRKVIEAAHRVLVARQERRGRAGLYRWDLWDEPDPILTIVADEVGVIVKHLDRAHLEMVLDILRLGRALGVRIIQIGQGITQGNILAPRNEAPQVRKLLAGGGFSIAHRDGAPDKTALESSAEAKHAANVADLPEEGGWAVVMRRGQLLSRRARVLCVDPDEAARLAESVHVRHLAGADAEAAGEAYVLRHAAQHPLVDDPGLLDQALIVGPPEPPETVEQMATSDSAVLKALQQGPGKLAEITGRVHYSRRTVSDALARLEAGGRVRQDGQRYELVESEQLQTAGRGD